MTSTTSTWNYTHVFGSCVFQMSSQMGIIFVNRMIPRWRNNAAKIHMISLSQQETSYSVHLVFLIVIDSIYRHTLAQCWQQQFNKHSIDNDKLAIVTTICTKIPIANRAVNQRCTEWTHPQSFRHTVQCIDGKTIYQMKKWESDIGLAFICLINCSLM